MRHGTVITRIVGGLLAAGLVVATAGTANAQDSSGGVEASTGSFNIQMGLKWSPVRYNGPVGDKTAGSGGASPCWGGGGAAATGEDCGLYGFQTTSLDSYLGFFFHPQIGIILGLDIGYGSAGVDSSTQGTTSSTSTSFFQFGFSIGGKFYLTRPTGQKVSPYLYVDFFKYFASVGWGQNGPNPMTGPAAGETSAIASLHSPLGFDLAFGAEYFFTNSFSLGAEVFGFRFAYVSADMSYMTQGADVNEHSAYFTMYTALTLNYRFLASASVRLEADADGDNPRPVRKKPHARPRPAPVDDNGDSAPPPPSPESVD